MSAATANIDNDQTNDSKQIQPQEITKKTQQKKANYRGKLFVHYTHEKRFQSFKRNMHHVYENHVFKNKNTMDRKLIAGNHNRRDA